MIRTIAIVTLAAVFLGALGLQLVRWRDAARADAVWKRLAHTADPDPATFDPAMVSELPEPARRYFEFAIAPGTPLAAVAMIEMDGEIGLGTKAAPGYLPMQARQILAPSGLVWKIEAGKGFSRISGSDGLDDGISWTRFWLLDVLPVVRAGGGADHARAAFGRVVAESVFWTPAALLPAKDVSWEPVSDSVARATVRRGGLVQTVDVTVAEDGRPTRVVIPRWTNANPEGVYRLQPFGGELFEFRNFDGFTLPTRVEGGNMFGTDEYFPFYKARVREIRLARCGGQPHKGRRGAGSGGGRTDL
jgi:hypothetical protein